MREGYVLTKRVERLVPARPKKTVPSNQEEEVFLMEPRIRGPPLFI